jgi:hypothetical protein
MNSGWRAYSYRSPMPMQKATAMRLRIGITLALSSAFLVIPLTARADSQPVSGTVGSTLGITVSGPVTLSPLLLPGQTSTGSGTIAVVATGPWVLRLKDGAASNAGHLQRTTGTTGTSVLSNALDWSTSGTGVTGGSGTLDGTNTVGASGTFAATVTTNYSQGIGSSEQLATGSVYSLTVTWTISAS